MGPYWFDWVDTVPVLAWQNWCLEWCYISWTDIDLGLVITWVGWSWLGWAIPGLWLEFVDPDSGKLSTITSFSLPPLEILFMPNIG